MSTLPYFPTPASPEQMTEGPNAVQLTAAGPARQGRLTVFFRLLMAIPQGIVLCFLAIAALVVAFIGWWAALFTGRLPQFAVDFVSGFLRWTTRVYAYDYLLTDAYPPFTLDDDPAYTVRVAIPEPQRLNQLDRQLSAKRDPMAGGESLFIGQVHSGEIFNQYPQECRLEGTPPD